MIGKLRASWRGERASAAVEFALVLPLLLIMALALLQVGLFVKDELVVEEVARAGAREAAVTSDDDAARRAAIAAATSLDPDRLELSIERTGGQGDPVSVRAVYHAPLAVPLIDWLFPSQVDLSAAAVMRQESG